MVSSSVQYRSGDKAEGGEASSFAGQAASCRHDDVA